MPIFKQGDDIVNLIADNIINAAVREDFPLNDGDIVGVTEAVVARTQGNYATCEQMAEDIKAKLGGEDMGIVFPILSRNRFSIVLKAIAMSCKKLYVQLSYPADEVGNLLVEREVFDEAGVNPYTDNFTEAEFRNYLYAPDIPDPDLLIRTGGEMRISNFLLWQLSYSELYVTPVYWPDFGREELKKALDSFAARDRRFGGLNDKK
jgi:hypothetical protein